MKKRLICLLTAMALFTVLLSACGGKNTPAGSTSTPSANGGSSGEAPAANEEPTNIIFAYVGMEQPEIDKVVAAINELTMAELNMSFEVRVLGYGDYIERLNLMLSGGDDLDILPVYYTQASSYINQGQIVDLSELLISHGSGIVDQIGEDMATAGTINGFLYGIPAMKESASGAGIVMRKDIVDELNIDVDSISTYQDLTEVFETVSAAYPDLDMISGANTMIEKIEVADPLFDFFGVLMDNGQSTTVENYFESEWYRSRIEIVSDWYQKGWVKADAATTTETPASLMKAGTLFSYISAIKPGFKAQEENLTGHALETAYIGYDDGTPVNNLWSNGVNFFNWGIAANSKNPEKAMEFLEFCYTNSDWNNLMNFGIENEHYVFVDGSDTVITFPDGVDAGNTQYHLNIGWELPNQFIGHVWQGYPEDVWQQYEAFNDSATKSKAFGFIYDSSGVTTELTALENVKSQYKYALECGSAGANWESTLEQFNSALYTAGLQTVMDEKQAQLDEWLAS